MDYKYKDNANENIHEDSECIYIGKLMKKGKYEYCTLVYNYDASSRKIEKQIGKYISLHELLNDTVLHIKKGYIGEGSYSKIKQCEIKGKYNNITQFKGVIKKVYEDSSEIKIMKLLENFDNIIKSYGYIDRGLNYCYLIMEYSEIGDLYKFINENKKIISKYAIKNEIVSGIVNGIRYLHNNSITHNDLKSDNIIIFVENGKYIPKIIDFGLSSYSVKSPHKKIEQEGNTYALFFKWPYKFIINDKLSINSTLAQIYKLKCIKDLYSLGIIIIHISEGKEIPISGFSIDTIEKLHNNNINKKIFYSELKDLIEDFWEDVNYPKSYRDIVKFCTEDKNRDYKSINDKIFDKIEY